jgi:hypothetical protein
MKQTNSTINGIEASSDGGIAAQNLGLSHIIPLAPNRLAWVRVENMCKASGWRLSALDRCRR